MQMNKENLNCQNPNCADVKKGQPPILRKNGKTKQGKQRYICSTCHKTISVEIKPSYSHLNKKGHQSERGVGEIYASAKSDKQSLALTPTAREILDKIANYRKLSQAEVVERFFRYFLSEIDLTDVAQLQKMFTHQPKKRLNQKSLRGRGEIETETKSKQIWVKITAQAKEIVDNLKAQGYSLSQGFETYLRSRSNILPSGLSPCQSRSPETLSDFVNSLRHQWMIAQEDVE